MRNGIGNLYYFESGNQPPDLVTVADIANIQTIESQRDAFAIQFAFDSAENSFIVRKVLGVTQTSEPPISNPNGRAWDFRSCSDLLIEQWRASGSTLRCEPDRGLVLGEDYAMTLVLNDSSYSPVVLSGEYFQVGLSATYPPSSTANAGQAEKLNVRWGSILEGSLSLESSEGLTVVADGLPHVYWINVRNIEGDSIISTVQLEMLSQSSQDLRIQWISVGVP